MFTGLVEAVGRLTLRERRGPGFRLEVRASLSDLVLGESIAVNGACLTLTRSDKGRLDFDVSQETVDCSNLGRIPLGSVVNLERALRLGARLGGHLVSGHVDGLARVRSLATAGDAVRLFLEVNPELLVFVAPKGSVALDGVSLTVNTVAPAGFDVMLIPHTLRATTLEQLRPGNELNLEVDPLARYIVHYLRVSQGRPGGSASSGSGREGDAGLVTALKRAGLL